jgi:hypothetical protein
MEKYGNNLPYNSCNTRAMFLFPSCTDSQFVVLKSMQTVKKETKTQTKAEVRWIKEYVRGG